MKHILSAWDIRANILSYSLRPFGELCFIFVTLMLLLFSCSTVPNTVSEKVPGEQQGHDLTNTQEKLVEASHWALGKTKLNVNGKVFNLDCSGTVMAIYYYAGIDLSRDFNKYNGGGTSRIYQYLDDKALIYDSRIPAPGDIIFWDNTFDSNGDGLRNDYLTHMGIVVEVEDNGTVTYLHEHYRKGIILESMNLKFPDDTTANSAMRMRGTGMEGGWLSSHLYRELAMGYKLEE